MAERSCTILPTHRSSGSPQRCGGRSSAGSRAVAYRVGGSVSMGHNPCSRRHRASARAIIGLVFLASLLLPAPLHASAQHASAFVDQGTLTYTEGGDVADIDPANNEYEWADTIERNID